MPKTPFLQGARRFMPLVVLAAACGGGQAELRTHRLAEGDPLSFVQEDAFAIAQLDFDRLRASPHAGKVASFWTGVLDALDPEDDTHLVMEVAREMAEKTDLVTLALSPNGEEPDVLAVLEGRYESWDMERWFRRLAGGDDGIRTVTENGRAVIGDGSMTGVEVEPGMWVVGPAALLKRRDPTKAPGTEKAFRSETLRRALEDVTHGDPAAALAVSLEEPLLAPFREALASELGAIDSEVLRSFGVHFDVREGVALGVHTFVRQSTLAERVAEVMRARTAAHASEPFAVLLGVDELFSSGVVTHEGLRVQAHFSLGVEQADRLAFHLDHLARGLTALQDRIVGAGLAALLSDGAEPTALEDSLPGDDDEVAVAPAAIERFRVPLRPNDPAKGPAEAEITIVEFADFQCPFSARVRATLERIMRTYPGRVRIVFRHNPLDFHTHARAASRFALEALAEGGADQFWAAHDVLFDNQSALAEADLLKYATELKLNVRKVRRALDRAAHEERIRADQALATRVGASGTPGFFINGRRLMGAHPFDAFASVIDEELVIAERLMKEGVPRASLYARHMEGALEEAEARPLPRSRRRPDPSAVYKVAIGNAPSRGPRTALVTIVQFSDFQCPFCKRVEPTLQQLLTRYGSDLRLVWLNNPLPFHQDALPAALAALEAYEQGGSAKFWRMHDLLFGDPQDLGRQALEGHAAALGLDMAAFQEALDGPRHRGAVEAEQALARELGATGTPTFFINGRLVRGAQELEAFVRVIDAELARAKKLLRSGVPRRRIYEKAIEGGERHIQYLSD